MLGISSTTKLSNRPKNELAAQWRYWPSTGKGTKVRPSSTKDQPVTCRTIVVIFRPNRLSDEQQFRSTDIYRLMPVQKAAPAAFR